MRSVLSLPYFGNTEMVCLLAILHLPRSQQLSTLHCPALCPGGWALQTAQPGSLVSWLWQAPEISGWKKWSEYFFPTPSLLDTGFLSVASSLPGLYRTWQQNSSMVLILTTSFFCGISSHLPPALKGARPSPVARSRVLSALFVPSALSSPP